VKPFFFSYRLVLSIFYENIFNSKKCNWKSYIKNTSSHKIRRLVITHVIRMPTIRTKMILNVLNSCLPLFNVWNFVCYIFAVPISRHHYSGHSINQRQAGRQTKQIRFGPSFKWLRAARIIKFHVASHKEGAFAYRVLASRLRCH